jgi:hypothetical protein
MENTSPCPFRRDIMVDKKRSSLELAHKELVIRLSPHIRTHCDSTAQTRRLPTPSLSRSSIEHQLSTCTSLTPVGSFALDELTSRASISTVGPLCHVYSSGWTHNIVLFRGPRSELHRGTIHERVKCQNFTCIFTISPKFLSQAVIPGNSRTRDICTQMATGPSSSSAGTGF